MTVFNDKACQCRWSMAVAVLTLATLFSPGSPNLAADEERPISTAEAIARVNQNVFVEMLVKTAKNRLEKRGEIYLDSEDDFHDEKNLAVVILRDGVDALKKQGIDDPAEHFRGQTIRVRGKVILKDDRPRIEITSAAQIERVKKR